VNLSGNGVLWSKAIPDDELLISFELWLKRNGHMPGLERLDDYVQEMKPRTLKEGRCEVLSAASSVSRLKAL